MTALALIVGLFAIVALTQVTRQALRRPAVIPHSQPHSRTFRRTR